VTTNRDKGVATMTTERRSTREDLDPGAYIGHEPEREADSIPGGVRPGDERVAAYGSQGGVPGEPDDEDGEPSVPIDGDTGDVVEGPVGSASLKDPDEAAASAADLDALPDYSERANRQPSGSGPA
jgi:hypothetical protein